MRWNNIRQALRELYERKTWIKRPESIVTVLRIIIVVVALALYLLLRM